ncbi:uncharacterized protein LOC110467191 isoform X1 [Mizuhopecten yessoensis]|uniref:Protein eva-1-like C n=1 Tax=Mizuhopecten yessoensis TaxID=6573 RepID=A0A210PMF4_MIZYE|nr:uncharacterized protein LOC110467191 isoform X1 [Mizuhopecten yessoensis]OWF37651.1 Protein eva-1-like C [Mizuhopecten yessoensis]
MFWRETVFLLTCISIPWYGVESSGYLTSTLFTFENSACDGEKLHLNCPPSTMITIQSAEYGRKVPSYQMCPRNDKAEDSSAVGDFGGHMLFQKENTNCLATTSFRVLLDRCQNQRKCVVEASTDTFRQDPCPRTSKYLKVSYKCNPDNFTNQTVCQGDQLTITCQKSTRIVIYSALFGRTSQDNLQCSSGTSTAYADCRSRTAVQEIMSRCHGRKRCAVEAEEYVFGNPCPPGIPKYLNVVYTCVPKRILKENSRHRHKKKKKKKKPSTSVVNIDIADSHIPSDLTTSTTQSSLLNTITRAPDIFPADDAKQPGRKGDLTVDKGGDSKEKGEDGDTPNTTVQCNNHTVRVPGAIVPSTSMERAASGMVVDWFNTFYFLRENHEKAVLYLVLGVCFGIISLLLIVVIKLMINNRRKKRVKLDITDPTHSHFLPPPNHLDTPTLSRADSIDRIEIVRFEPRSTLRRDRDATLRRDFESHIPLRTDFEAEDTLRSDPGDRSLNNYYG